VSGGANGEDRYVSTGHLPAPGRLRAAVDEAYRTYRAEAGGENSRTYPALARVPGKSGIGGGIVAVSPGKGALGTFSPLLDRAGNSVRGQLAARHLSGTLGLSLFASEERRHG
jgi:glutaminase